MPGTLRAVGAVAVQRDGVRGDFEARRSQTSQVARTLVNVEHLRAVVALKVVMMAKMG